MILCIDDRLANPKLLRIRRQRTDLHKPFQPAWKRPRHPTEPVALSRREHRTTARTATPSRASALANGVQSDCVAHSAVASRVPAMPRKRGPRPLEDGSLAIRQNRASGACRLAANDRVEAVVDDGLDLAPAAGDERYGTEKPWPDNRIDVEVVVATDECLQPLGERRDESRTDAAPEPHSALERARHSRREPEPRSLRGESRTARPADPMTAVADGPGCGSVPSNVRLPTNRIGVASARANRPEAGCGRRSGAAATGVDPRPVIAFAQGAATSRRRASAAALQGIASAQLVGVGIVALDDNQHRKDSARRDDRFVTRSETPRCARFAGRVMVHLYIHLDARAWGNDGLEQIRSARAYAQIRARRRPPETRQAAPGHAGTLHRFAGNRDGRMAEALSALLERHGRQRRERQLRFSDRQPVLLDEPRSESCRGRREPLRISPGEHKQDSERVAKLHRSGQLVRGGQHDRRLSDRQRTLEPNDR